MVRRKEAHQEPDCLSCWWYPTCENAAAGSFCTEWTSDDPEKRRTGEDPNVKWRRGEGEGYDG